MYVGDEERTEQALFITERHCFTDLISALASPCSCGLATNPWVFDSATQVSVCMCMHACMLQGGLFVERACFACSIRVSSMPRKEDMHGPAQGSLEDIT